MPGGPPRRPFLRAGLWTSPSLPVAPFPNPGPCLAQGMCHLLLRGQPVLSPCHCGDTAESLQPKSDMASLGLCDRTAAKSSPQGSREKKGLRQADPNLQNERKPGLPLHPGTGRACPHNLLPPSRDGGSPQDTP